ncbi:hypothetical protein ACFE04_009583 [Oxalis oulophora]
MERIIGETNGIIRKIRLEAPLHFVWKIESYSTLLESKWNKIESGSFEVDGHKWKLTFFPNGNNNHKGEGYISLYLSISDTENPPLSLDLSVIFKFLVFDQIKGKYLAIQDSNEMCRFQWMKTEWGFGQLLPLGVFKDPSNGFLIDDRCIFGVDIFVEFVESDDFIVEGLKWKLKLYPKGKSTGQNSVSLFLLLVTELPDYYRKVYAEYKLRICDQVNGNHLENTISDITYFDKGNTGWGIDHFVPLSDVNNMSKGFLLKDAINVEVEFSYISVFKQLS